MEVEINYKNLSESPYSKANADAFTFNEGQVEDLLNDLSLGSPTCYLVSGYRGVGKTSLIKKVEDQLSSRLNEGTDRQSQEPEIVFVHTSFARYETRTHIVRRLIRELYLKIEKNNVYLSINDKEHDFKQKFEMLYQQTFKEVSVTTSHSTSNETTVKTEISVIDALKKAGVQIVPLLALIPWYIWPFLKDETNWFNRWVVPIGLVLWSVINIVNVSISDVRKKISLRGLFTKTLFDDEIAGTLFFDVLKNLQRFNLQAVFVLDELDKVPTKELDSLINELKPYLICGHANFVVVGGQNLYYKFNEDDNVDDAVLSSLFAKVFHVQLSSPVLLKNYINSKVIAKDAFDKLSNDHKEKLEELIDYLIFASRLVPRRFVTLLRQNIYWKNKIAYLTDDRLPKNANLSRRIIDTIDKLDDEKIAAENPPAIRDYIIMKMYIKCYNLFKEKTHTINKKSFVDE